LNQESGQSLTSKVAIGRDYSLGSYNPFRLYQGLMRVQWPLTLGWSCSPFEQLFNASPIGPFVMCCGNGVFKNDNWQIKLRSSLVGCDRFIACDNGATRHYIWRFKALKDGLKGLKMTSDFYSRVAWNRDRYYRVSFLRWFIWYLCNDRI